jgi:Mn-dependent DtxR family transcriptional regulator
MTSVQFAYWLQGFFEISKENPNYSGELNSAQVKMIEKHLSLVFVHEIDNSYGNKEHTDKLNNIHNKIPSYMSKDEDNLEINLRPRC